jgi:hypothetical protein
MYLTTNEKGKEFMLDPITGAIINVNNPTIIVAITIVIVIALLLIIKSHIPSKF